MSIVPSFKVDSELRTISVRGAQTVVPLDFEEHLASLLQSDTAASFTSDGLGIERTLNGRYVLAVEDEAILLSRDLLVHVLIEFLANRGVG